METGKADADIILNARVSELESIDLAIIGEVLGVSQAIGDLRKALDSLESHLDERQFEKAAALGYRDIASAFIFLQRTLGGLQCAEGDRHAFVSIIAEKLQCAYEDAEPHVSARLQSLQPKPELTDEERAAAKAHFQLRIKELYSTPKE